MVKLELVTVVSCARAWKQLYLLLVVTGAMPLVVGVDSAAVCCGSQQFAQLLSRNGPYQSIDEAITEAQRIWWNQVGVAGWLEAFSAHPRIGDVQGLKEKFGAFGALSHGEQAAAISSANEDVHHELATWNQKYEEKFGHIFILCASGKTAQEMLQAIKSRYANSPCHELSLAAAEQMKITELRLKKLLLPDVSKASNLERAGRRTGLLLAHLGAQNRTAGPGKTVSPITTHVLDTTLGRPAQGLPITLMKAMPNSAGVWETINSGSTNEDGRIPNLLPASDTVAPGKYRMVFDTQPYLLACQRQHPQVFAQVPFYPQAVIEFVITPDQVHQHFHIPLLLSPYGYSTYRGS